MEQNHRLTIGLPVYNGGAFLAESLESLLGQTYEDFSLIISDNASTDGTAEICEHYARRDPRVRYIRQPTNIGLIPNENFVMRQATTELFKLAAHDDLYGRDLLKRCIEALDSHPEVVAAHCWEARIDSKGTVVHALDYPVKVDLPHAPDRFRSMLFDGWDDYMYGVIRTDVLLATHLCGSYHLADRTINLELSLHGPFYLVPEWLYFRREHEEPEVPHTVRSRCAVLDYRRANRFRHPVIRLYGEYLWSYITAIRSAPLSPGERQECYRVLARWLMARGGPVLARTLGRQGLPQEWSVLEELPDIPVDSMVAGRSPAGS